MAHVGSTGMRFWDYGRLLLRLIGLPPMPGCPRCGSPRLVELVYGEPCPEALEAARKGLVRLGGRPMEWVTPELSCLDCGADVWVDGRWREPVGYEAPALGQVTGGAGESARVGAAPSSGLDLGDCVPVLAEVAAAQVSAQFEWGLGRLGDPRDSDPRYLRYRLLVGRPY